MKKDEKKKPFKSLFLSFSLLLDLLAITPKKKKKKFMHGRQGDQRDFWALGNI